MTVNVDQARFAGGMADHVGVPDFLVERARGGHVIFVFGVVEIGILSAAPQ